MECTRFDSTKISTWLSLKNALGQSRSCVFIVHVLWSRIRFSAFNILSFDAYNYIFIVWNSVKLSVPIKPHGDSADFWTSKVTWVCFKSDFFRNLFSYLIVFGLKVFNPTDLGLPRITPMENNISIVFPTRNKNEPLFARPSRIYLRRYCRIEWLNWY